MTLPAGDPAEDPLALVSELLAAARESEPFDATAASLATVDANGQPSVRIVLVKGVDARGLTFFTNYGSRKAQQLAATPRAALCLYWPGMERQVRAEGEVARIDPAESDAYFASRPRDSQLGAWASRQSTEVASREELEARFEACRARFEGSPVPRPPFWGGFRLRPERVELWQARPHRLHDRLVYLRSGDGWRMARLCP